ncbi:MAG: 50S ribosomal protein L6 [Bacteroidales bacterium]|jgi:large subunit ribosomal protein L6|nr:50S ribosomal protein L6 [Bacteroidales bacterium]
MSRIGKLPINLPAGVQVSVSDDNTVTVKGPLGSLQQKVHPDIKLEMADGHVTITRPSDERQHRSMHGLYRSLLANMVKGVSEGFTITQELIGVGYKAQATGQLLELTLGYSHYIVLEMPPEISVTTVTERGKNPTIIMKSIDKQLIGQVAAKIRSFRKPEPYKGKGIRFMGEEVRRKAGKAAAEK